jgi:hypothetical protein
MRKSLTIVSSVITAALTAIIILFCSTPSRGDSAADPIKDAIQSEVHAADLAIDKGDSNGAIAFFAPNYAAYDAKGKVLVPDKATGLAGIKALLQQVKQISSATTITSIKLTGSQAQTQSSGTLVMHVQNQGTGKFSTVTEIGVTTDLWVRTPSGIWLDQRSTQVSASQTTTGK